MNEELMKLSLRENRTFQTTPPFDQFNANVCQLKYLTVSTETCVTITITILQLCLIKPGTATTYYDYQKLD